MSAKTSQPTEINVVPLTNTNSAILTYLDRNKVFMNPPYQRPGNIWSDEKKQLLIDSILNHFDIPKLYFHEFLEPKVIEGKLRKFAVIDGKQRLLALWEFIENGFPLSDDFEYLPDPTVDLSGLTYRELAEKFPHIKALFDNWPLAIMVVRTEDTELIEDMFSRLNEAVPLNSAEKRNAFGGPIPPLIRRLANEPFFKVKLPFENSRYRHFDVACKFLYLAQKEVPTDTKKIDLDEFVKKFTETENVAEAKKLFDSAKDVIVSMKRIFVKKDPLLKNIGTLTAYFLIFQHASKEKELGQLNRKSLLQFEQSRKKNAEIAAKNIAQANYELLKFDELVGTVNDEYAIRFRCRLIANAVFKPDSRMSSAFPLKLKN